MHTANARTSIQLTIATNKVSDDSLKRLWCDSISGFEWDRKLKYRPEPIPSGRP
jgi:hypothetical protein